MNAKSQCPSLKENEDSTEKEIIYQVALQDDANLSYLLADLQQQFGNIARIDVETNSLEDAYLNIAREEEKLLQ